MPKRALRPCKRCGRLRCEEHGPDTQRERREGGLRRLYSTAAWERTRGYVLRRDPLCKIRALCGGLADSVEVDHVVRAETWIERHDGDQSHFYDTENLQGACHRCHSHKTALEMER